MMSGNLLTIGDNLNSLQSFFKKRGIKEAIFYLILYSILISLTSNLPLLFLQQRNNNKFESLENDIKNINQNINQIQVNIGNFPTNLQQQFQIETPPDNNEKIFNEDDWIIEKFLKDDEGYYCPTITKNFNYWSIWSKKKLPLKFNQVKIRLKIKSKLKLPEPATIVISYGEYIKNKSPSIFYRLNIFDDSMKSIRLYDDKNKVQSQDWLEKLPDLDNEMVINLSPRTPEPKGRKLYLNPELNYKPLDSEQQIEFRPKEEFYTFIPSVDLEDDSIQQQIGIGTKKDVCIKPIAIEILN